MNIELLISDHSTIYLPVVEEGITWSTERKGAPGQLSFTVVQDGLLKVSEGNAVRLKADGKEIFYGFVFKLQRDKEKSIKITAYDQLRYFKNKDTYRYKDMTAGELLTMLARDFRLKTGTIEDTGFKIAKRSERNKTLFDIVQTALDITLQNTKNMYVLYDDFGKLALKSIASLKTDLLLDADTGENFDYTSSIDTNTYNKIKQDNRNRLLWRNASIDGLKTGHTKEAGYCLASSEKRGNIRFIAVVLGADKESDRYDASQALFNYGFAQFEETVVIKEGQNLSAVPVYKGTVNEINVRPQHDVKLMLPVSDKSKVVVSLDLNKPIIAPLTAGQEIGTIRVKIGDKVYATLPAVAGEAVDKAGFFKRSWHSIKLLF